MHSQAICRRRLCSNAKVWLFGHGLAALHEHMNQSHRGQHGHAREPQIITYQDFPFERPKGRTSQTCCDEPGNGCSPPPTDTKQQDAKPENGIREECPVEQGRHLLGPGGENKAKLPTVQKSSPTIPRHRFARDGSLNPDYGQRKRNRMQGPEKEAEKESNTPILAGCLYGSSPRQKMPNAWISCRAGWRALDSRIAVTPARSTASFRSAKTIQNVPFIRCLTALDQGHHDIPSSIGGHPQRTPLLLSDDAGLTARVAT